MTMTAVSQCPQCVAVINVHWPSCLVCRAILAPILKVPSPSEPIPENQRGIGKPHPPLLPGWLVTYRNQTSTLCGGADDKAHGTVRECQWELGRWVAYLTDGQQLPLSVILAVAPTHPDGRIRAAWTVREHGYDGNGPFKG